MVLRLRRLLHLLWIGPTALLGVVLIYGGGDAAYVARVLIRRDGNVDDYAWKRTVAVAPSRTPVPWREAWASSRAS